MKKNLLKGMMAGLFILGSAMASVYAATKHAVRVISEGLRKKEALFKTNIRVTDMARAVIYAINEPDNIAINEIIVQPTNA